MDEIANELLTEFANEASKQQTTSLQASSLRWQVANDRYPPAVVILTRGKERKTVATISPTSPFAHLYPSWQPVIGAWISKRLANGKKRVNHQEIANGDMP